MPQKTYSLQDVIREEADRAGVPAELALAVAERESSFNPGAIGKVIEEGPAKGQRAVGVFQIVPSTAQTLGIDPTDPIQNIQGGVKYLNQLLERHQGDTSKVLADYGGVVNDKTYVPGVLNLMKKYQPIAPAPAPAAAPPTATPVRPTTSAAGRFGSELLSAGVVEPVTGIASLLKGIVTDPKATLSAVGHGILDPVKEHGERATAARQAGDLTTWANEITAAIPIIGPMMEGVSKQTKSGDYAGAAGRALGTASTFMVPKALSKVKAAKDVGAVPLLRSERTGSGVSQFLEHIAERTTPGRGIFRQFRERQQLALQEEGERLASALSQARGSTETGRIVTQAIDASMDARKIEGRALYSEIDNLVKTETKRVPVTREVPSRIVGPAGEPLTVPERTLQKVEVGGVQPKSRVLKQAAIPILRRVRQESKLLPPQELARTTALLERIINAPDRLPFSAFQDARSDLLKVVRSVGDPVPGKAGGVAKLLAEHADDAMMTAAEESGIAHLPGLVREANAFWRDSVKSVYNAPFIKTVLKESPEAIPDLMRKADVDDLAVLQKAVGTTVYRTASARVLRDVLSEATTQTPAATPVGWMEYIGVTPQGSRVTHGPLLDGKVISKVLERMGPEKAVALFGPSTVRGLEDLAVLADRVRPGQANRVAGGLVAAGLNASIVAPLLGPILRPMGVAMNPAATAISAAYSASAAASLNILARILTKPEGLTLYRGFLRSVGQGNRPQAILFGTRLAAQIEQQDRPQPMASHPQEPPR